ncbi:MAG: LysR substrate-binding domain-containing protein [Dysosmobacter welbionis]
MRPGYLEGKNSLTLAELAEERLLLRERGSGTRNSVDAGLQGAGATAQPVVESVSTAALLACARAGLGITLLPRSLVVTDLERGTFGSWLWRTAGFTGAISWCATAASI